MTAGTLIQWYLAASRVPDGIYQHGENYEANIHTVILRSGLIHGCGRLSIGLGLNPSMGDNGSDACCRRILAVELLSK